MKLIIANWKMQKAYFESVEWVKAHKAELVALVKESTVTLAICPEFTALACISSLLKDTELKLGAQDCGMEQLGSFTGDVSPLSLKQLECSYCIIGHSERRTNYSETISNTAKKANVLISNGITPILCIGETEQERRNSKTVEILKEQLAPVLQAISNQAHSLVVAYEPLWAIGTGKTASAEDISNVCQELAVFMSGRYPEIKLDILYGGSVSTTSIKQLTGISSLKGFLIGKASTDFQELKKIVLLVESS